MNSVDKRVSGEWDRVKGRFIASCCCFPFFFLFPILFITGEKKIYVGKVRKVYRGGLGDSVHFFPFSLLLFSSSPLLSKHSNGGSWERAEDCPRN